MTVRASVEQTLKAMDKSKLYAVGIAAFVLGGVWGSYVGAPLGHGDAFVREQVQQLNQRLTTNAIQRRQYVSSIVPPEFSQPVPWLIYALLPPLVVAAILGLWTRAVLWSLSQLSLGLNHLLFGKLFDFTPKPLKLAGKS
jgi:hypothetical protein